MKEDFYAILGIDKSASAADIKKAYRKKAIEYHPDKNPGDAKAEELFKKAAEAYEILSDPDKKAKYDQYGHAAFEGGFGGGGMNMDDIFSQFGDIFGSAFGGGGFGGSNQPLPCSCAMASARARCAGACMSNMLWPFWGTKASR